MHFRDNQGILFKHCLFMLSQMEVDCLWADDDIFGKFWVGFPHELISRVLANFTLNFNCKSSYNSKIRRYALQDEKESNSIHQIQSEHDQLKVGVLVMLPKNQISGVWACGRGADRDSGRRWLVTLLSIQSLSSEKLKKSCGFGAAAVD